MERYVNRQILNGCIAFLFAIHMVSMPFYVIIPLLDKGPATLGLDVSWQMMLSYANTQHWVWGKDIVYTYGPLGYLCTRIGLGTRVFEFLLLDFYIVANFFYIYRDFIESVANIIVAFFLLLMLGLIMDTNYGGDLPWLLMVFSFYWMYKSHKDSKYLYIIASIVPIVICLYVKLNAGLIGTVFYIGHLVNSLLYKKLNLLKSFAAIAMLVLSIAISAMILNVSLPLYFKGALEIIKGYNDVMFLEMDTYKWLEGNVSVLFYAMFVFCLCSIVLLFKNKKTNVLYYIAISVLYLFLLRKQSSLRNDANHYYEFLSYAAVVFLPAYFTEPFERYKKFVVGIVTVLFLLSLYYTSQRQGRSVLEQLNNRYTQQVNYINEIGAFDTVRYLEQKDKRYIPADILDTIGNKSVDIYPWDCEYLFENKLNYTPRPVFQSFSSYTQYLQEVNYNAYLNHAPDYIFYEYESIDERYPFNDDILLQWFIVKNYTYCKSFYSNTRWIALLKKKENIQPIKYITVAQNNSCSIADTIQLVANCSVIKIDLNYNVSGYLQSLLYRPPVLRIAVQSSDGVWHVYRCSRELLSAGVMVDKLIQSNSDYIQYVNNKDSLKSIKAIKIVVDTDYFAPELAVRYINTR